MFEIIARRTILALQAGALLLGLSSASIAGMAVLVAPASAAATACSTSSTTDPIGAGASCSKGGSQKTSLFDANGGVFTVVANTLTFLVGAIAVIYLILGGLRYVTSQGDSKAISAAKDTILYAVIGIIVAIVAFALVQFVVNALGQAS